MDRHKFIHMPNNIIPQAFIDEYNLLPKSKNGCVYMRIIKEMYGLPQAGMIANKVVKECLEEHGYYELIHTPGLFTHKTRPIWFKLVVDDFDVKHIGKEHTDYLMSVL